jgi:hypothetical protein
MTSLVQVSTLIFSPLLFLLLCNPVHYPDYSKRDLKSTFFLCVCGTDDQTQEFTALYHLSHTLSPFVCILFLR